jgi:hypothetical protein
MGDGFQAAHPPPTLVGIVDAFMSVERYDSVQ